MFCEVRGSIHNYPRVGGYQWTDGTSVNYVKWTPGEPTLLGTHGQVEECVEFSRDSGTWNDVDCYTNRGYVCKSQRST